MQPAPDSNGNDDFEGLDLGPVDVGDTSDDTCLDSVPLGEILDNPDAVLEGLAGSDSKSAAGIEDNLIRLHAAVCAGNNSDTGSVTRTNSRHTNFVTNLTRKEN